MRPLSGSHRSDEPVMLRSGTLHKRLASSHESAPQRRRLCQIAISRPNSLIVENQTASRSPLRHHVTAGQWLWGYIGAAEICGGMTYSMGV